MASNCTVVFVLLAIMLLTVPQYRCEEDLTDKLATFAESNHLHTITAGIMRDRKLVYARELIRKTDTTIVQDVKLIPAMDISHLLACLSVLNLEDDGFIDLSESLFDSQGLLDQYASKIKLADDRFGEITILEVMQQTIGWGVRDMKWKHEDTPDKVLNKVLSERMSWTPGASYNFSVLNEYLIRAVIEVRSGLLYEDYVKEHILTPLGMFHTKIYNYKKEKNHPKRLEDYTNPLMTKLWYTSLHDVMRLLTAINGHSDLYALSLDKIDLLYSRPAAPYPQSTRHWHSAGFFLNRDGSFWIESVTSNGHYLFIFNTGTDLTRRVDNHLPNSPPNINTLMVVYVKGMTHKHFKPVFLEMMKEIKTWPETDIMIHDLADSTYKGQHGVRVKVSEHNLKSYMNAVRHAGFTPTWINAFSIKEHVFFSIIFKKSSSNENWVFESGISPNAFERRVAKYEQVDIELVLTQQYTCVSHQETLCHFILLRPKTNPTTHTITYQSVLRQNIPYVIHSEAKKGFTPVVISISENLHRLEATSVFRNPSDGRYNWFLELDAFELNMRLQTEASKKFYLEYLNAYTSGNRVLFCAGLRMRHGQEVDWMLQKVSSINGVSGVKSEIDQMAVARYIPKLLVGYNRGDGIEYMILYRKMV